MNYDLVIASRGNLEQPDGERLSVNMRTGKVKLVVTRTLEIDPDVYTSEDEFFALAEAVYDQVKARVDSARDNYRAALIARGNQLAER